MNMYFIASTFLVLHTVSGSVVYVRPDQITHLRPALPSGSPGKLYTDEVHCQVNLVDGKFVTVTELCEVVQKMLEEAK